MDSELLMLSSLRSLIMVVQKCQVGMDRMEAAEAKAADWAAEREKLQAEREQLQTEREALQKALEAKDRLLREEASKSAGLAADLEQAQAEGPGHGGGVGDGRSNNDLVLKRSWRRLDWETLLRRRLSSSNLLWQSRKPNSKRTLKKVGVPRDSPVFRNPLKFPRSDSNLHSIIASPFVLGPSSLTPPAASAGPEARAAMPSNLEVPLKAPPMADVAPETLQATPEATLAGPEAGGAVSQAPLEIDYNVDAVAL
ncbi:hypothetical protein AAC387_Pa10g0191 [Persea americana]